VPSSDGRSNGFGAIGVQFPAGAMTAKPTGTTSSQQSPIGQEARRGRSSSTAATIAASGTAAMIRLTSWMAPSQLSRLGHHPACLVGIEHLAA
jgi:hypothetical protein